MASVKYSGNWNAYLITSVSQVSQNIPGNTSTVRVAVNIAFDAGATINYNTASHGSVITVTVDGQTKNLTVGHLYYMNYAWESKSIGTLDFVVPHTTTGSKTANWSVSSNLNAVAYSNLFVGSASDSGSLPLTHIPRDISSLSLSSSSIARTTATVSWSTDIKANRVEWKVSTSSTWTGVTVDATSGTLAVSYAATAGNTNVTINVRARSAYTSVYTSKDITIRTPHESFVSVTSFVAKRGTTNTLTINFTSSQTGGTTTVQASFDGGGWTTISTGRDYVGYSPGTSHSIRLRALNSSSGYYNYTSTYSATTWVAPAVSRGASALGKTGIRVSVWTGSNATNYYATIRQGATITHAKTEIVSPFTKDFSATPGLTYTVIVEAYSSVSGLTTTYPAISVTIPALVSILTVSASAISRGGLTVNFTASEAPKSVNITVNSVTKAATLSGSSGSASFSGLTSNTTYTLTVTPVDATTNGTGTAKSGSAKTAAFSAPTSLTAVTNSFNEIEASVTVVSDTTLTISISPADATISSTNITAGSNTTQKYTFKNLKPQTTYTISAKYVDAHNTGANYTALTRTQTTGAQDKFTGISIDTISTVNASVNLVVSFGSTYAKSLNFYYGTPTGTVKIGSTISIAKGTANYTLSIAYTTLKTILAANPSTNTIPFIAESTSIYTTAARAVESTTTLASVTSGLMPVPEFGLGTDGLGSSTYTVTGNGQTIGGLAPYLNKLNFKVKMFASEGAFVRNVTINISQYTINASYTGSLTSVDEAFITPILSNIQLNNASVKVAVTDSRGLVKAITIANGFIYVPYSYPQLSIRSVTREGFTSRVIFKNLSLTRSNSTHLNIPAEENVVFTFSGGSHNVGITSSKASTSVAIGVIGDSFSVDSAYTITASYTDKFGFGVTLTFPITTAKGLLFLDEARGEIGINTTNPMATLDVSGDIVADNILFFVAEDVSNN